MAKPKPAVKPAPFQGLTGDWCCECATCHTLNVYLNTATKRQPPSPLACQLCDDRAVAREERKRRKQEEAAQRRWGS